MASVDTLCRCLNLLQWPCLSNRGVFFWIIFPPSCSPLHPYQTTSLSHTHTCTALLFESVDLPGQRLLTVDQRAQLQWLSERKAKTLNSQTSLWKCSLLSAVLEGKARKERAWLTLMMSWSGWTNTARWSWPCTLSPTVIQYYVYVIEHFNLYHFLSTFKCMQVRMNSSNK